MSIAPTSASGTSSQTSSSTSSGPTAVDSGQVMSGSTGSSGAGGAGGGTSGTSTSDSPELMAKGVFVPVSLAIAIIGLVNFLGEL